MRKGIVIHKKQFRNRQEVRSVWMQGRVKEDRKVELVAYAGEVGSARKEKEVLK